MLIGGVYCAACIQKIEGALKQNAAVQSVRLNFSTRRLNIVWRGSADLSDSFVRDIADLGYTVEPYDFEREDSQNKKQWRRLLMCLGVAGFSAGNIMLLSLGLWITDSQSMGVEMRHFLHLISALIAFPAVFFSGQPFFQSAWSALRKRQTNMDVPIAFALLLTLGISSFEMATAGDHVFFDSAVMLTFFLLIGRVLDFQARRNARQGANDLMKSLQGFGRVLDDNQHQKLLPVSQLKPGMRLMAAMGEKIVADGRIIEGVSQVDASLITGETLPQYVQAGDDVFAGTLNLDAPLMIEVTKPSDDSLLADIVRMMEVAEQNNARYVRLADRAARFYTPVVHILAAITFLWWVGIAHAVWQDALMTAVTVLIITCPCALGLAVPVVQVLASSLLMKKGIFIKSGDALERLADIDTVVMDKTGTLTQGRPVLLDAKEYDQETLNLAVSLAQQSVHPLAQALQRDAVCTSYCALNNIKEHPGLGVEAAYNGKIVRLGRPEWCGYQDDITQSASVLCLKTDENKYVLFYFDDHLKVDAIDVVKSLKQAKMDVILLSGDHQHPVEHVAQICGIDTYHYGMKPDEKYDYVRGLKERGKKVLMVGDGLNDAAVLAEANASMAPSSGLDITKNVSDIVFTGEVLSPILSACHIARRSVSLVRSNFGLAIVYNVIAIPVAFMGLVTPMIAALAMSGSSLLVIVNSLRLKLKGRALWM